MTPLALIQRLSLCILIPVSSFAASLPNPGPHLMDPQDRYGDPSNFPRPPQAFPSELIVPKTPKTARTIKPFQSITSKMSMTDVIRLCGLPDRHLGSGIHIFVYNLNDGSSVTIGTPDLKKLFYVTHETKSGKSVSLLPEDKKSSQ